MKRKIVMLLLIVVLSLSLAFSSFADGAGTNEESGEVVTLDISIVIAIFAGAALVGGAFGYWLVRKRK